MKHFVFDSFAMIALFRKEKGHEEVITRLKQASGYEVSIHMSSINVGELYYMLCRKNTVHFASIALEETLKLPIQLHEPKLEDTLFAARLKSGGKISFADAHAAALTIALKATLITGDREFDALLKEENFQVKYLV